MSWQNNWTSMPQPNLAPGYPPPIPGTLPVPVATPMSNYGPVNSDQYNQWQWQQYQQQYAQWYAMYGEKYAQQTGSTLPPVPTPMPHTMPSVMNNPYVVAPLPVGSAFPSINMTAPPPPAEPHPDELRVNHGQQKPPLPEDKSPEEISFDEQFWKWEEEFEAWKRTNINHPDKAAYKEYEQKYEDQRKKLLDHRAQLRRKRLEKQLSAQAVLSAPIPDTSLQPPPPPPPPPTPPPEDLPPSELLPSISGKNPEAPISEEVPNGSEEINAHRHGGSANNLQNVFNSPGGSGISGGIPGLDLIDENSIPVQKKIKLEENVIDLTDHDGEGVSSETPRSKPDNVISVSSLLNDPNVNALLQLVGKSIAGSGSGGNGTSSANNLVAALAQLTSGANSGNVDLLRSKSVEIRPNGRVGRSEEHTIPPRPIGPFVNVPPPIPPPSIPVNNSLANGNWARQNLQGFNPRVPPPLLEVDLSQPPPSIRPPKKPQRDRWNVNPEQSSENGPLDGGHSGDGSSLPKIPRFDRPPPPLTVGRNVLQMDPELGRPVAVPKPEWMTEDEYQDIYDRYEHVRSFDERKTKMELAIQVLKQNKIRENMPKPLPVVPSEIKTEVDEYFQPKQVFDYSNCRSTISVPTHPIPAGRVIDYGHRGANQYNPSKLNRLNNGRDGRPLQSNTNHCIDGGGNELASATKRFDYNHSRMTNAPLAAPLQQSQNWTLPNTSVPLDRSVPGIERLAQMHLNPNPEESNPNYPSKFLLMNDNRPNCLSTKRGKRPSSIRKQKLKQMQQQQQQQQQQQHQEGQNGQHSNTVVCKQEPELALEDLSSGDEIVDGDDCQDEERKPIKDESADDRSESVVSSLSSQHLSAPRMIDIDDLLFPPGRYGRPPRLCLLIRGLPGSGKSYLARLIKDKEQKFGPSPRVLSLDDYFLVDREEEVKDAVTGKVTKMTRSHYEFDGEMEDIYIQNLIKAFKRTISERLFNFVIVDCCNHRLETYCEFHNYARSNGFKVYTCTMQTDVDVCAEQNIHNRTEAEIQVYADNWAMAPDEHVQVNFNSLLDPDDAGTDMTSADMELVSHEESNPEVEKPGSEHANTSHDESNDESAEGTAECDLFASKWDHDSSEQNLARLDGTSRPLRRPPTLEDYLQLDNDSDDGDECRDGTDSTRKKKRVRWADVEERKAQKKMRQLGFVVGVTDWTRMMDPTEGSSALTQTKYIERVKKQP